MGIIAFLLIQSIIDGKTVDGLVQTSNNTNNANATQWGTTNTTGGNSRQPTSNISAGNMFLTYHNPDFGLSLLYPANWTKQEDNLTLHTLAAFSAIHEDKYNFVNSTWAEVDLRIYNAPPNETFSNLNLNQLNTQGQVIVNSYKNSTTTLGGLPALKIVNYFFGVIGQKQMQMWTFVPTKNKIIELVYTALPSKYSIYLPVVEKMIDSVRIR
jgi:hypothetical protein